MVYFNLGFETGFFLRPHFQLLLRDLYRKYSQPRDDEYGYIHLYASIHHEDFLLPFLHGLRIIFKPCKIRLADPETEKIASELAGKIDVMFYSILEDLKNLYDFPKEGLIRKEHTQSFITGLMKSLHSPFSDDREEYLVNSELLRDIYIVY